MISETKITHTTWNRDNIDWWAKICYSKNYQHFNL